MPEDKNASFNFPRQLREWSRLQSTCMTRMSPSMSSESGLRRTLQFTDPTRTSPIYPQSATASLTSTTKMALSLPLPRGM
ncbi:hypothetical protein DL98DRAFT_128801 [Cadophora sp. DSE1049]|nr:hypothetical protein DL98DRAFT_128801 [Cadophora sp. DSE1049]